VSYVIATALLSERERERERERGEGRDGGMEVEKRERNCLRKSSLEEIDSPLDCWLLVGDQLPSLAPLPSFCFSRAANWILNSGQIAIVSYVTPAGLNGKTFVFASIGHWFDVYSANTGRVCRRASGFCAYIKIGGNLSGHRKASSSVSHSSDFNGLHVESKFSS